MPSLGSSILIFPIAKQQSQKPTRNGHTICLFPLFCGSPRFLRNPPDPHLPLLSLLGEGQDKPKWCEHGTKFQRKHQCNMPLRSKDCTMCTGVDSQYFHVTPIILHFFMYGLLATVEGNMLTHYRYFVVFVCQNSMALSFADFRCSDFPNLSICDF